MSNRQPPGSRFSGSNAGKAGLRVNDGIVDVFGVTWITVTAGTLTDLGGGHVSITTGGGGGGSLTVRESDGSPSVPNVTVINFDQTSGFVVTDDGGGIVTISIASHWYSIFVTGQTTLTPTGQEDIEFVAGTNVTITTDNTAVPKEITWSVSGGAGSTGPTGPTGATGAAGGAGASGGTGATGPSGTSGPQGIAGPSGTAGASGTAGP